MTTRSTANEVLVIIGAGGMGVSVARRVGAGRTIVLADINAAGLNAAADALTDDGHRVLTREVDVTSRSWASHGDCSHRRAFAGTGVGGGGSGGRPAGRRAHHRRIRPRDRARRRRG